MKWDGDKSTVTISYNELILSHLLIRPKQMLADFPGWPISPRFDVSRFLNPQYSLPGKRKSSVSRSHQTFICISVMAGWSRPPLQHALGQSTPLN